MKITKHIALNSVQWRNERGLLHREDGPAIEYNYGRKEWLQNGNLHRLDGPAIEYPDGDQYWYFNGEPNRFGNEAELATKLKNKDLKSFVLNNYSDLDEGEVFLLRLTITNHFPEYLDFLKDIEKYLVLL